MEIRWHGFFRVSESKAARKVALQMAHALERSADLLQAERYWKIPELYDVQLVTGLQATDPRDAVLETLDVAQRLGGAWSVTGPSAITFEGVLAASVAAGSPWLTSTGCSSPWV